ncbi:CSS-motif domain-containing protein [Stenotrophomonas maltophilia]|nr:CSS-motif domain-containing protein [Stenotrophomonas maltophilia]
MAMLAVAQAILYVRDKEGAEAVAEAAVTRSEALSLARRVAAEQASRIGQPPCSATDIDSLKEIAFRSSYMNDIGRIRDGRLVCSALLGALAPLHPPRPTLLQRRCPALARIGSRWLPLHRVQSDRPRRHIHRVLPVCLRELGPCAQQLHQHRNEGPIVYIPHLVPDQPRRHPVSRPSSTLQPGGRRLRVRYQP